MNWLSEWDAKALLVVFVICFVALVTAIFAGGYNPEYEADRQFRTALNGEIFTGDEEADQAEITRLMKLPRFVKAFPTGELAKSNWIYLDPSLEYAIEYDWRKVFRTKGKVIFNRTEKRKKK